MTDLTEALLNKPVGPTIHPRRVNPDKDYTKSVQVRGDVAEVEVRIPRHEAESYTGTTAVGYLVEEGLNPAQWEVVGFRVSEWTMANGEPGVSKRFNLKRCGASGVEVDLSDLLSAIEVREPTFTPSRGDHGFIVALGDMQFGKIDGDGVAGTLQRTVDAIDHAADLMAWYEDRYPIGHVHVAWLGDHVEGFVSQGGANTWRTGLTLSEQIRLTRRVMLHAMMTFAPLASKVSMVAVPGNHGEPQRFAGKGLTTYDDSHDTESLIAVSEVASMTQGYEHVEFYVPQTDQMSVVVPVAGTTVAHAHGHAWRPGKHFDWWRGQAFHDPGFQQAELLLAGHLHHKFIETDGPRQFIQVPSMESESTWYRHRTGTTGDPGLIVAVTKDGLTDNVEVVR